MNTHIPRKRFGQHFLHDKRVIRQIIASLAIKDNDIWVEIGPGRGALTQYIPTDIKHLYLIEIDNDLARDLSTKYDNQKSVSVINRDILTMDFSNFADNGQRLRLLGNLPYNISTPIFFHLADYANCIKDMTFMIQKEVADRLTAKAGNKIYGRLTLSAGLRFSIHRLFDVGPGAFNPPPKVKSSVIRLTPHSKQIDPQLQNQFDMLVRTAFSKRRKTIKNSLGELVDVQALESAGIDPKLRPESLTQHDFLSLAERMI